nr:5-oxoprolinase subunit PxpA [Nocardia shimofusensis]
MPLDLNSDLGEGFGPWTMGDDAAMLDLVTSANIACGFHAGDPSIMRRTCELAAERDVRIGAHVGHRDLVGFGRRTIDIAPAELRDEVLYQIGSLDAFARAAGSRVRYVKPHGALYHSAGAQRDLADALIAAMIDFDPALVLLGPAGTALEHAAVSAGVRFVGEGFADRAYTETGGLAPREVPGAVLPAHDAVEQAVSIATTGGVRILRMSSVTVRAARVTSVLPNAGDAGDTVDTTSVSVTSAMSVSSVAAIPMDPVLLEPVLVDPALVNPVPVSRPAYSGPAYQGSSRADDRAAAGIGAGRDDADPVDEAVLVRARSLCVHGDSPAAVEMARRIRAALAEAGVAVEAFT